MITLIALSSLLSQTQTTATVSWKIEVESRDSPILVQLDVSGATAMIRRGSQSVKVSKVVVDGNKMTLTLPNNFILGNGEMTLIQNGIVMDGSVRTKDYQERINGIKLPLAPVRVSAQAPVNGPGFLNLKPGGSSLAARLAYHKTAGVSLARIENNTLVETGFFGTANAETKVPVTENTIFQAGGMGSTLVCLAALKLADEGRLDLSRSANDYLRTWKIPAYNGRNVTVADLLRGSSGLSQYKFRGYRPFERIPTLDDLFRGIDRAQFEPVVPGDTLGTQTGFVGINHEVLGVVLSDVTRKPFSRVIGDLIFKPFGMSHSTYDMKPRPSERRAVCVGHYETGEPILDGYHVYPTLADSGLWTTAPDMAQVIIQASLMLSGKPNKILSAGKLDLLKQVGGSKGVAGFVAGGDGNYFHGGDTYGMFSNFRLNPSRGTGVVVMTNRVMNWRLVNELNASIP
jgi:CubicO group peptidase (beta-lactamase class C family)